MRALFCLLMLGLGGCVHVPYKSDSTAARTVKVESGGGLEGGERWIADGYFLVRESYRFDGLGDFPLRKQTRSVLTSGQWGELWRAIDGLALESWNAHYSMRSLGINVTDSPGWSVDLRRRGKRYHCEGDAAYPQLGNPRHPTRDSAAVQRLFNLFERFSRPPSRA